jgi:hypothetical protein
MLHIALEPIHGYGFSSLNDYQFVSQAILCLLPLLYSYHYLQYLMDLVVSFYYIFYYICFIQIQGHLACRNPLTHLRENFV